MNVLPLFKQITTFVFDVDGVLTDGSVLLLENGLQARSMNIKDGLALQMAAKQGYRVLVVSGGASEPVLHRLQYLGLQDVHLGVKDKLKFFEGVLAHEGLGWETVLFMGDDLPDLPLLQKAGLPCCPADAVDEVKAVASYISPKAGGAGAVRDVIEKVLKLNNRWTYHPDISSR